MWSGRAERPARARLLQPSHYSARRAARRLCCRPGSEFFHGLHRRKHLHDDRPIALSQRRPGSPALSPVRHPGVEVREDALHERLPGWTGPRVEGVPGDDPGGRPRLRMRRRCSRSDWRWAARPGFPSQCLQTPRLARLRPRRVFQQRTAHPLDRLRPLRVQTAAAAPTAGLRPALRPPSVRRATGRTPPARAVPTSTSGFCQLVGKSAVTN